MSSVKIIGERKYRHGVPTVLVETVVTDWDGNEQKNVWYCKESRDVQSKALEIAENMYSKEERDRLLEEVDEEIESLREYRHSLVTGKYLKSFRTKSKVING